MLSAEMRGSELVIPHPNWGLLFLEEVGVGEGAIKRLPQDLGFTFKDHMQTLFAQAIAPLPGQQ